LPAAQSTHNLFLDKEELFNLGITEENHGLHLKGHNFNKLSEGRKISPIASVAPIKRRFQQS